MRWPWRYDNFWATVGVHPDNEGITEPTRGRICSNCAARPRVVGIGETGLDYYRLEGARAAAASPTWTGSANAFAPTSAPRAIAASR